MPTVARSSARSARTCPTWRWARSAGSARWRGRRSEYERCEVSCGKGSCGCKSEPKAREPHSNGAHAHGVMLQDEKGAAPSAAAVTQAHAATHDFPAPIPWLGVVGEVPKLD